MRTARRLRCGLALLGLLGLLAVTACGRSQDSTGQPGIRIATFDFVENQLLGEIYAEALGRAGYPVVRLQGLGPREVVLPALQQGLVDLVPEYAGSAQRFLSDSALTAPAVRPADPEAALRAGLAERGLTALAAAPGEDQNGVAVSRVTALQHGLRTVTDLGAVAGQLTFGGPPECLDRPLCLRGLQALYGLTFRTFIPFPSRAATAEALLAGRLDVGMLETVDAYLADGRLVLLRDDRGLQPAENIIPVLRRAVLDEHGAPLAELIDRVTGALSTPVMTALNRQVVLEGRGLEEVAAGWLDANGTLSGTRGSGNVPANPRD